ncbi:unnamed protein product [Paramecium sonneborni]|uniref:Uncharacterized protein n=1 Tax=Paramecium sonneborni TaxID=65129 RepID=A0A8S1Q7C3_9CILI|nr:unnamed protein product [Paramecium sonneborni]
MKFQVTPIDLEAQFEQMLRIFQQYQLSNILCIYI